MNKLFDTMTKESEAKIEFVSGYLNPTNYILKLF